MASEIGVQTIQHTNGTDAMTIDSSGRVLRCRSSQIGEWAVQVYLKHYATTLDIFDQG